MTARDVSQFRRWLLWLLLVGAIGTLADLLLTKHWKEVTQWPPLVLLCAMSVAATWTLGRGSRAAWQTLRGLSWLYLPAAVAGVFFHVRANIEWARDDAPALSGWPLVRDTLFGTLPTLAPGAMLYLGLIGLLVSWRRPAHADSTTS